MLTTRYKSKAHVCGRQGWNAAKYAMPHWHQFGSLIWDRTGRHLRRHFSYSLLAPIPLDRAGLRGFSMYNDGTVCKFNELHHQNSAPNPSRLGVFICGFHTPRGLPGRSACAASRLAKGDTALGSPLFCPIFSRNLRQLLRRGSRRRPCPSTTCACSDGNGWLAGLHEQSTTANPRGQPPRQPLGGNGSSP